MAQIQPIIPGAPVKYGINFSWNDLASGLSYATLYCVNDAGSNLDLTLTPNALPSVTTTGYWADSFAYFQTSPFALIRTVSGVAYITGYAYGATTVRGAISAISNEFAGGAEGTVDWSDASTYTDNVAAYTLKSTITIDGYVTKVTYDAKISDTNPNTSTRRVRYTYAEGDTYDVDDSSALTTSYASKTATNPYYTRKVASVKLYMSTDSGGDTVSIQNQEVYSRTFTSTINEREIAAASTVSVSANGSFILPLTCTDTTILKGEILRVFVGNSNSANITSDAAAAFLSTPTLKVEIPFKIE